MAKIKDHPILCSPPMMPPLVDGSKTETRRLTGLQYINEKPDFYTWLKDYNQLDIPREAKPFDDDFYYAFTGKHNNSSLVVLTCPYGKPGDILFVRESWRLVGWDFEDRIARIGYTDGNTVRFELPDDDDKSYNWLVKQFEKLEDTGMIQRVPVKNRDEDEWPVEFVPDKKFPFSPSIHLPKWCSRIRLQVKEVKVERLQQISKEDAIKEGIESDKVIINGKLQGGVYKDYINEYEDRCEWFSNPVDSYESLWKKLHGPDSWNSNPWVWVIKFKKIKND